MMALVAMMGHAGPSLHTEIQVTLSMKSALKDLMLSLPICFYISFETLGLEDSSFVHVIHVSIKLILRTIAASIRNCCGICSHLQIMQMESSLECSLFNGVNSVIPQISANQKPRIKYQSDATIPFFLLKERMDLPTISRDLE